MKGTKGEPRGVTFQCTLEANVNLSCYNGGCPLPNLCLLHSVYSTSFFALYSTLQTWGIYGTRQVRTILNSYNCSDHQLYTQAGQAYILSFSSLFKHSIAALCTASVWLLHKSLWVLPLRSGYYIFSSAYPLRVYDS